MALDESIRIGIIPGCGAASVTVASTPTPPDSTDARLESALQAFLGSIVRLAGARAGAVRALDADGARMHMLASTGLPPAFVARERIVEACGVCGDAMKGDAIQVADSSGRCRMLERGDALAARFEGSVAVPLTFRTRTVGVFTLFFDDVGGMRAEVLPLLRPLGHLLGLTLENARLEREQLDARLLSERQAMAGEIHDSLAQSLAFVRMRVPLLADAIRSDDAERALRYCDDVGDELATTNRRLRELITHFRAGMDAHGLERALEQLTIGLRERTGIDFELRSELSDGLGLAADREVQAFHIVREAVANVCRHAHASHARIVLARDSNALVICVEDDGRGLPEAVVAGFAGAAADGAAPAGMPTGTSCGLQIMRERARAIGGSVELENLPGGGARVRLRVAAARGDRA
ncbi:MAG: GAF domain-containing sensor histidine kinase [Lautropia sp.]